MLTSSASETTVGKLDLPVLRELDTAIVAQWLRYADLVSRRGYVSSQLGNIALRVPHRLAASGLIYTKQRGISLEEATREHVVVTGVDDTTLLFGARAPSIGHQLNAEVFRLRPDINAVIHLHVDEVLAYFTVTGSRELRYVSSDTGIIMGKPPFVLDPEVNVELDVSKVREFIADTNVFVMPNHGITTLGSDISIAYNRLNAFVAEVRRLQSALILSSVLQRSVPYLSASETESLYALSSRIL